mgnify:CR=1 FL=1
MLVHTVFFYLKPEVSEEEKAAFMKRVEKLGEIETVVALYVGTPAETPPRPVIKTDYSVSLTAVFDHIADQNIYQDHPIHLEFVDNNKDLWTTVAVYDAD